MEPKIPEPFWIVYATHGDLRHRRVMYDPRPIARMKAIVKSIIGEAT